MHSCEKTATKGCSWPNFTLRGAAVAAAEAVRAAASSMDRVDSPLTLPRRTPPPRAAAIAFRGGDVEIILTPPCMFCIENH
jgi:hypothetical protein